MRGFVDTIVEVIDPRTGQLVASHRYEDDLVRWGQGPIMIYNEDENGVPSYSLYEPRLVRGRGVPPTQ